jgi:hypothetical protein
MPEISTNWDFPLAGTSMDAGTIRPSVLKPNSALLSGVDGTLEGPLRPFPGFREIHRFDHAGWATAVPLSHDTSSEILDVESFNFTIHNQHYGYGFVYRVRRRSGAFLADLFIDYYNSYLNKWIRSQLIKAAVPLSPEAIGIGGQPMKVISTGRLLYIFMKDQEPILCYVQRTTPFGLVIKTNTGPGLRPSIIGPDEYAGTPGLVDTGTAARPGAGQLILTEFKPSELIDGTTPVMPVVNQDEGALVRLTPGDYAFSYLLVDSETGRRSALSEIAEVRKIHFDPDASGEVQPLPLYAVLEVVYDSDLYDQCWVYRSVRVQDAGGTYIANIQHLDKIIDLEDHHTANNPLAGSLRQALYWYELTDKQLTFQDTFADRTLYDQEMPKGGSAFWYENTLLVGDIRTSGESVSDENRPEDPIRGTGELRWSSTADIAPELYPPGNRFFPSLTSNDIITMRQAGPHVIGFSRDRQYLIRKEDTTVRVMEMHEGFGVLNNRSAETVGSNIYFVGEKGVKSVDAQGKLDDVRSVNRYVQIDWAEDQSKLSLAYDSAMSCLFLLNPVKGEACLFWFNSAMVTHLKDLPFAGTFRGVWPKDFTYDLTNLESVAAGGSNLTYKNSLTERTFFWQNPPKDSSGDEILSYRYRLFVTDHQRVRTRAAAGDPVERTLMPIRFDACFPVQTNFSSGTAIALDSVTSGFGSTIPPDAWGCKLYVLKAANASLVGRSATIREQTGDTYVLKASEAANLHGLVVGDVVAVSPVVLEWQGSPVATQAEDGTQFASTFDYFNQKTVAGVIAAFSDVSLPYDVPPSLCRYEGAVYRGTEVQPVSRAYPIDARNRGNDVQSIRDREGFLGAALGSADREARYGVMGGVLTPGIIIMVPNVDYYLLGVRVNGQVLSTDRSRKGSE